MGANGCRSAVTKAFEVCDNVVEEIFGLKGLEFEIVMSRVNTEDMVAHQRRRFDRCYFREWDRLEYLLERSLKDPEALWLLSGLLV